MKKIHFALIIIVSIILLEGCNVNDNNNQNHDDETIEKALQSVENYLSSNYKNIDSIEFSDDFSSPMGGLSIRGTVNNNDEANFSIGVTLENNYRISSIGKGKEFPERKEECKEQTCDY